MQGRDYRSRARHRAGGGAAGPRAIWRSGFALNNGQLKRAEAMSHYQAAEKLAPGDADALRQIATFYAYGAQQDRATRMIEQVIALDPLNARAFRSAGYIALFARDYPKVIARMERAARTQPQPCQRPFRDCQMRG